MLYYMLDYEFLEGNVLFDLTQIFFTKLSKILNIQSEPEKKTSESIAQHHSK